MKILRVLVACEFSGVVRRAFTELGHDAWSCDILPSEHGGFGSPHYQGDVLNYLNDGWDIIIGHPPCTYLCNSGVRWLAPGGVLDAKRHESMKAACDFFAALYFADCPRICIENPIMHKYARDYLKTRWNVPAYTQTIQPFEHGHGETKRTGLWLRGLPPLKPSNHVAGRTPRVHFASPGKDRWKERSRTLEGIGHAMANQWGNL